MMKSLVWIILSLLITPIYSQIEVTDPGLLNCLSGSYPSTIINDTQIDTLQTGRLLELSCNSRNIKDISLFRYFRSVKELSLDNNPIMDFSPLKEVTFVVSISLQENSLSSLPDLTELSFLSSINLSSNEFTSLPKLPEQLKELDISRNILQGNVDLAENQSLVRFISADNAVDSLKGLLNLNNLREINLSRNGASFIESFEKCDSLEKVILLDNSLREVKGLTNKQKLTVLNLSANRLKSLDLTEMSSSASVSIENNNFTFSNIKKLNDVLDNSEITFRYSPQNTIFLDSTVVLNEGESFEWQLDFDKDVTTNVYEWIKDGEAIEVTNSGFFQIPDVNVNQSGTYTCIVVNTEIPDLLLDVISVKLNVIPSSVNQDSSPLAFSPGLDGAKDTFYFSEDGEVVIFDRFSNQIIRETGPFEWNGRDEKGQLVPVGVYIVRVNGQFWNQISIIR